MTAITPPHIRDKTFLFTLILILFSVVTVAGHYDLSPWLLFWETELVMPPAIRDKGGIPSLVSGSKS